MYIYIYIYVVYRYTSIHMMHCTIHTYDIIYTYVIYGLKRKSTLSFLIVTTVVCLRAYVFLSVVVS